MLHTFTCFLCWLLLSSIRSAQSVKLSFRWAAPGVLDCDLCSNVTHYWSCIMCLIVKIGLLLCFTIDIEYCLCKDWIVISLGLAVGNLYVCHNLWHQIRWLIMWWARWPVTGLFCVCLCLFTYVWSHVPFWKLYIVLMLRELTSLSRNINFNSPGNSWWSHDPVTGGPAHKLSPSQGDLRSLSVPWGPSHYNVRIRAGMNALVG